MIAHSATPATLMASVVRYRGLFGALVRRDVLSRYQGSALGLAWSLLHPLLMLSVYTFVFSVVFQARWPGGTSSKAEFAIVLFAALIVFNLFAECVTRSPAVIVSNSSYATKVVFPLELLPLVPLAAALFHAAISVAIWLVFHALFLGIPPGTLVSLPLIILPLLLMAAGVCWFLASLGVYLRDVSQIVSTVTMFLLFLSPVFYAESAVPERFRDALHLNPLTSVIEQARDAMIWGRWPDWRAWAVRSGIGMFVAWLGFAWFQRTRRGFADVL